MLDLDRRAALDTGTRLAVRAQTPGPKAPSEARIAETEPKSADLVIQGAGPYVWVLIQSFTEVGDERFERVRFSSASLTGDAFAVQVVADRLSVSTEVAGDR
jgi:hypothetical protein